MARPRRSVRDVDVVVDRHFLARCYRSQCDEIRRVALETLIAAWIARVVHVPLGKRDQDDLAIRVRAVFDSFSDLLADRRFGRDLTHNVDTRNSFPGSNWSQGEDAEPFDTGRTHLDVCHGCPSLCACQPLAA